MKFENRKYDVVGIGNAIVDILSFVDEEFLKSQGIDKGIMTLIDEDKASKLYTEIGQTTNISGGCAGNTVAGIVSLGGKAAYMGRVKDDDLGAIFMNDLNSIGVKFDANRASEGKPTARSFILVTPDADRTMLTFLGACTEFSEEDVDENLIRDSKIMYVEGYLWDQPKAKQAIRKAIQLAKQYNTKISFTLSDPFCVSRHRAEFLELLNDIDILFCNEDEAKSLFETKDIKEAVKNLADKCELSAVTLGKAGSLIISEGLVHEIPPKDTNKLVDTTGAGDLYAAGVLFGLTNERSIATAGHIGSSAASTIISQLGARPSKPLKSVV